MGFIVRFVTSLAIVVWGVVMLVLGVVHGVALWVFLGLAVAAVGVPMLASHPWAARRLYPPVGGIASN